MGDADPPALLSRAWLEALDGRLRSLAPIEGAAIALGILVTGVPVSSGTEEEVCYVLHAGGTTGAWLAAATLDGADVVMVEAYADARALAAGEVTAAELFARGLIKVRGDAARLVAAGDVLQAAGEAFGPGPIVT